MSADGGTSSAKAICKMRSSGGEVMPSSIRTMVRRSTPTRSANPS